MKNLPREWLVGAVAALVAVVCFLTAGKGQQGTVSVSARGTYEGAPVPSPRWLAPDFPAVWPEGRDPMAPSTEWADLPAEDLGIPDFPANPLPVLPIRPASDPRAALVPVTVAAADLPDDAALTALRATGKSDGPAALPEEELVFDTVVTPRGNVVGTILRNDENGTVQIRLKDTKHTQTFKKGEYTEIRIGMTAAKEYQQRAAAINPSSAKDHEELAAWCLTKNLRDEGARELEASLRIGFKPATLAKLVEVYAGLSDPDREIRLYRELLEKRPTGGEAIWARLGRAYEALGLPTRAVDAYLGAIKVSPFFADAKQRLVTLLSADGRLQEAEGHATSLSADPKAKELPETRLAAGTLAYHAGRFEDAKAELTAAGPAGAFLLGCAEASLGRGREAAAAFRAALEANPDLIDAWLDLGLLCALAGDNAKAQACFDEAAFRAPVSPNPWAASGWLLMRQAKAPEAGAAFDEALRRDPRCSFALLGKGKLALDGGDAQASEPLLLAALKAGAGRNAFLELGLARLRMRNTSGAVEALRRAAQPPAGPDAHALLGFALLPTNPVLAEQEFRTALAADPMHVLAGCGLAAVVYSRRELADARQRFEAILTRAPDQSFAQKGKRLANEAATRRWWHDEFERKDGDAVRRSWIEREKEGLRVTLAGGRAQFAGRQNRDDGVTALVRPTTDRFLSFEVELDFAKAGRSTAGLTLGLPQTPQTPSPNVVRFGRDATGKLAVAVGPAGNPPQWKTLGDCPAGPVRLRIERPNANSTDFTLSVNGSPLGPALRTDLRAAKLEVGVFGFGQKGDDWELGIDNVRLIEAK
ncbi:MAG: tetratricopeptide repeat protein [Planctomycetia bacterium]|nr:tetratricopeptide repeat protein [Planctomycetia bacterium]